VEEYKVLIHNSAKVMGMDPSKVLANVHPSLLHGPNELQTKNICDDILKRLNMTVQQLKEEKNSRRDKVISQPVQPHITWIWQQWQHKDQSRHPSSQGSLDNEKKFIARLVHFSNATQH
jgi:Ase1/PRC1/MAP65 family protein